MWSGKLKSWLGRDERQTCGLPSNNLRPNPFAGAAVGRVGVGGSRAGATIAQQDGIHPKSLVGGVAAGGRGGAALQVGGAAGEQGHAARGSVKRERRGSEQWDTTLEQPSPSGGRRTRYDVSAIKSQHTNSILIKSIRLTHSSPP